MPTYAYIILGVGWLIWVAPFLLIKRSASEAQKLDRRARWGIVLQGIGYSLLFQNRFWERPVNGWRSLLAVGLLVLASGLSWSGARALGRQWRIDAGVNQDHELVTSGPYRLVRHPIYASMLCLLLGTGLMVTPWPLLVVSILVFLLGTEFRIRIEDRLLASIFGNRFEDYRRTTSAYVPFVR